MAFSTSVAKQVARDLEAAHETGNAEAVNEALCNAQFAYDCGELAEATYIELRMQASEWGYDLPAP